MSGPYELWFYGLRIFQLRFQCYVVGVDKAMHDNVRSEERWREAKISRYLYPIDRVKGINLGMT